MVSAEFQELLAVGQLPLLIIAASLECKFSLEYLDDGLDGAALEWFVFAVGGGAVAVSSHAPCGVVGSGQHQVAELFEVERAIHVRIVFPNDLFALFLGDLAVVVTQEALDGSSVDPALVVGVNGLECLVGFEVTLVGEVLSFVFDLN